MNESRCKACDAELVYVGSLFKGGVLKCPHCDLSKGAAPAKSGSYLYANTQDVCGACGKDHPIWDQCGEDGA